MHYLRNLARLGVTDIHPAGASASRALIETLALHSGQRLLELGCGTGNTALRLARRADISIVGLDLLSEMLLAARRRLGRAANHCTLVCASASVLPFMDQSFDRVYAESVLGIQNDADIKRILAETFRVLKPGGRFVANEAIWRPNVDQSTVTEVNRQSEDHFGLRPASEHAWSVERWLDEIRQAGLQPMRWAEISLRDRRPLPARYIARLTRSFRVTSAPTLWAPHLAYRKRLALHRAYGSLIEARLFVATRPM